MNGCVRHNLSLLVARGCWSQKAGEAKKKKRLGGEERKKKKGGGGKRNARRECEEKEVKSGRAVTSEQRACVQHVPADLLSYLCGRGKCVWGGGHTTEITAEHPAQTGPRLVNSDAANNSTPDEDQ